MSLIVDSSIRPPHPFEGIHRKLERAHENILNLDSEVRLFFECCDYPVIPHPDDKLFKKAMDYYNQIIVPVRFSVISGEVIHHFRSCLDHIAWHFSSEEYRQSKDGRFIEFPILDTEPTAENKFSRYDRKIKGISKPSVLAMIDRLQPYKPWHDATDHILLIIHDMDRFDKHRELAIMGTGAHVTFDDPELLQKVIRMVEQEGKSFDPAIGQAIKDYGKATPTVAFRKFGKRKIQSVVPGLHQLLNKVGEVISMFENEL
jgi:hypothetical protein